VKHSALGKEEVFDHYVSLKDGSLQVLPQRGGVDVFEFYWAPLTTQKASFFDVVMWLAITEFTPVTRLSFNFQLILHRINQESIGTPSVWKDIKKLFTSLFSHPRDSPLKSSVKKGWLFIKYFVPELVRALLILLISIVLVFLASWIVANSTLLGKLTVIMNKEYISFTTIDWGGVWISYPSVFGHIHRDRNIVACLRAANNRPGSFRESQPETED